MINARIYTRFSQVAEGFWGASLLFEKGIEKIVKWYLFSKITPSLFVDKASCTRQFENEFSLRSLASLFPIKEGVFSTSPSLLQGELHLQPSLPPQKEECKPPYSVLGTATL